MSYRIRPGDTLSAIAARYKVSTSTLAKLNGIRDPNRIYAGQVLKTTSRTATTRTSTTNRATASARSYRVRPGDTLGGIAARFGTTVSTLARLNGIRNPNLIAVGRVLRLPGSSAGTGTTRGSTGTGRTTTPKKVTTTPPSGPARGGVSVAQLRQIMPYLPADKAQRYLPYLNKAMAEFGINTKKRQAAFLAQLGHESGGLRYMEEIASGAAYEGRRDLGNIYPGDGRRFKGRGPIQLTGRANYASASRALGIDLVKNPTRAADPDVGFRIAGWFWKTRGLNALADAGDFRGITRRINGGYNGLTDRYAYWARAKRALGA